MASLMAFLGLDATQFNAGMRNAQNVASGAGKNLVSSLGGMATGAIAGFGVTSLISSAVEMAEHIRTLSKEFRVSTDTIQIWERGAGKVGLSAEDMGNAMNRLKKAKEEALAKGDPGGFSAFGITMSDLADKTQDASATMQQMQQFTSGHPITQEQDVVAMELMGRGGAKILSAMQEINKLGPISLIGKDEIENLHEVEAALKRAKRDLTIGTGMIAGKIVGGENEEGLTDSIARGLVSIKEFFKGNWKQNKAGEFGFDEPDSEAPAFDLKGRSLIGKATHKDPVKQSDEDAAAAAAAQEKADALTKAARDKDEAARRNILKLEEEKEKLADKILKNQERAMPMHERQLAIKKEIAEHEANAALAMRIGNESLSTSERMKAEDARGRLDVHKSKGVDFNSSERIGQFNQFSFGGKGMPSMDHAQKTADMSAKIAQNTDALVQYCKGYILDPNHDRRKNTEDAVRGGGVKF